MRQISVGTDVYAAIWAQWQPGDESENDILRRKFNLPLASGVSELEAGIGSIGFREPKFDVLLPEGFEIFRNYKGTDFRARATGGKWLLVSTGEAFPSLNQLSNAVTGKVENAWRSWYFMGSDGKRYLVEGLRSDIPHNVRHLLRAGC